MKLPKNIIETRLKYGSVVGNPRFTCNICEKKLINLAQARKHLRKHEE